MPSPSEDLALALELTDAADEITLARFGAGDLRVETKPDMTPVTEADTAVERAVRERLADARPGDVVHGEEYGAPTETGVSRRWIIDPIDGTKAYVRGLPVWGTLLALEDEGELTVGVVSAPALRRRWWAATGYGAHVRGEGGEERRVRVSDVERLSDAQLCFGGLEEWEEVGRGEALLALGRACGRSRGYGDFWGYMIVAEGGAELMLDPVVSVWDLAAPLVIVEEAGGRFTDFGGTRTCEGGDALASNGRVHEAALAIVGR